MIFTKSHSIKTLAAAITLCVAPTLALAGDKPMSSEAKDAYREGQIWATYVANPALEAYEIDIDVNGNQAILTGSVESNIERRLAERIAMSTDGITGVDNRILVDPLLVITVVDTDPDFGRFVADATIEAMVGSKLLWNDNTDGLDIDVSAMQGRVTLTGNADTESSRSLAGWLAANTAGVVSVTNQLKVDAEGESDDADDGNTFTDTWVAAKVNSSLLWSSGVDGADIDVAASDGVVTLTGVVDSESERLLAIELAKNINGVTRVDGSGLKMASGLEMASSN